MPGVSLGVAGQSQGHRVQLAGSRALPRDLQLPLGFSSSRHPAGKTESGPELLPAPIPGIPHQPWTRSRLGRNK